MMRFLIALCGYSLFVQPASGQPANKDSLFVAAATRSAIAQHARVNNTLERLYNGPEYISYDRRLTGHAFFPNDTLQESQVTYEGGQFTVPLLYDIVKDEVVVVHPSGYRMALHSDRLPTFTVQNHTFIRLDTVKQALPTGFYDLLYDGPTQLLARRTKVILVNPGSFGYGIYDPRTTYYIRRNGHYFPVKTRRATLAVLADRRKQLSAYLRQQKIRFKQAPETALVKLVQQYDELTKPLGTRH
ncbi:hypothetical protein [uncultured Fibrella sp.]|uniref:hypothetical protein n=1 Tax=uncultured Fibrella sp. TaxID=1284596 RepID=UPI0035CB7B2E